MNDRAPYVDTSALAKWYLPEPGSEAFVEFITQQRMAVISRLTVVEVRCLLARRRRAAELTAELELKAVATFEDDIAQGHLWVAPLLDAHALSAAALVAQLAEKPLRTLDALHLAVARGVGVKLLATADRRMAEAARALGMEVASFG